MKYFYIILWVIGGVSIPGLTQPVEFFRERIEIEVADSSCTVNGTYFFRNPSTSSFNLPVFYPVVLNDSLPFFPDHFIVYNEVTGRELPFHTSSNGIHFNLFCEGLSITIFRVSYRQHTPKSMMEYILTTTQNWGKPLEKAVYVIYMPSYLHLTACSLQPDQISKQDGLLVYTTTKTSFLPRRNLKLYWERKKP